MQRPFLMEKTCLTWRKQYTQYLAQKGRLLSVKRNTLSFGTQAASTVNLTEGYPSVHSRTISLQTVRRYGTRQCGQDRDEFTY